MVCTIVVVVQSGKKSRGKFSRSSKTAFFIFQIVETGSHFSFKACAFSCINLISIYIYIYIYIWKVEPSNSLAKKAASFRRIGRRIRGRFPQNSLSLECKAYLFILVFYLLMFSKRQELSQLSARTLCPNILQY